jgi:hypothetical protein
MTRSQTNPRAVAVANCRLTDDKTIRHGVLDVALGKVFRVNGRQQVDHCTVRTLLTNLCLDSVGNCGFRMRRQIGELRRSVFTMIGPYT